MSDSEDLTPREVADNIRAMRRAEEITQERFGEFAAHPNWTVVAVWPQVDAAPYGMASYHGTSRERVRVTFDNLSYRLEFEAIRAVRRLHSAGEVMEFVREVELRLRD